MVTEVSAYMMTVPQLFDMSVERERRKCKTQGITCKMRDVPNRHLKDSSVVVVAGTQSPLAGGAG